MPETTQTRIIVEEINREPVTHDSSLRANVAAADTNINPKMNNVSSRNKNKLSKRNKTGKTKTVMKPTYVKMDKAKAQKFFQHNNSTPIWAQSSNGKSITISQDPSMHKANPVANLVGSVASKNGVQNQHVSNIINHSAAAAVSSGNGDTLTPHGKILANDTQKILLSADRLFQNKNEGQKLQNFASYGAKSIKSNLPIFQSKAGGVSRSAVKGKSRSAASYIQRLGYTFVKSGDLRDIVSQLVSFFKEFTQNSSLTSGTTASSSVIPPSTFTVDHLTTNYAPVSGYNGISSVPVSSEFSSTSWQTPSVGTTTIGSSGSSFDMAKKQRLSSTLLSLLSRLGSRHEYRKAVRDSFKLYDKAYSKAYVAKREASRNVETDNASAAKGEAKQFAAMFFGESQMNQFKSSSTQLVSDIRKDSQLNAFLQKFREFILYAIENPNGMQTVEKQEESMWMISQLEMFARTGNWGARFSSVLDDFNAMMSNLKNDQYLTDLGSQLQEFAKDFALNEQGRPDLFVMSSSVDQLKSILLPMLRAHLSNIPIDRVDISSPTLDLVLEDLKFNLGDILPDKFKFDIRNKVSFDASDLSMGKTLHELHVEIRDITPVLNKVKFYVHKKNGFKWLDWGLLDLAFRNHGMRIELDYYLTTHKSNGRSATLKLHKIKVGLDETYMKISQAHHGLLDKLVLAFGKGMIRKRIVSAVTDALTQSLTTFDAKVNAFLAQHPMHKLMDSADGMMGKTYYAAKDRKARARSAKKSKSNEPILSKLKRGANKAAKGIDTVAPTKLANSSVGSSQPIVSQPIVSSYTTQTVSAPLVQPIVMTTFTSVPEPTYVESVIPPSSWTSKAAPISEPGMGPSYGQEVHSVVTKVTETLIPTSAVLESTKMADQYQQKSQFTPTISHIRSA